MVRSSLTTWSLGKPRYVLPYLLVTYPHIPQVLDQVLGVAMSYSEDDRVEIFSPDGLVGLAFQSISEFGAPPLVQNLYSQGRISEPIFAFEFMKGQGLLHIGRSLASFKPGITYTPVTQPVRVSYPAITNAFSLVDTGLLANQP